MLLVVIIHTLRPPIASPLIAYNHNIIYSYKPHGYLLERKVILREFDVLIAQLEHLETQGKLSMQKLVFYLQPSKTTLQILDRLCQRLHDTSGGQMLDALFSCALEQVLSQPI